ncbi:LysR family transcriptional regulator [Roseibium sp. TrichSKD4]|nr:LysR family transcriptional regulator [Roseibium sp. TrichSKD4]
MPQRSLKRKLLPPLDYILAFEASAKAGSFAAASRVLNISETAISRKVRLLEQHYDVALFIRGNSSVKLTTQGENFLVSVQQSLDILRIASTEMFIDQPKNLVSIAATNSVASLWLTPRLNNFRQVNNRIKIGLVSSDDDEECLSEGMDLIILRGDGNWPNFDCRKLFGETVFPVCTPDFLSKNPQAADINKLASLNLIEVASTHPEWMNWSNWLRYNGISNTQPEKSISFNTYPLSIEAAANGLGLALGWQHLIDRHLETRQLICPLGNTNVRTQSGYYLLKRKASKPFPERDIVENWLMTESEQRRKYRSAIIF